VGDLRPDVAGIAVEGDEGFAAAVIAAASLASVLDHARLRAIAEQTIRRRRAAIERGTIGTSRARVRARNVDLLVVAGYAAAMG
jgi:folate-dependent phosphoribosylglycinamide formyltransferase PurN